MPLKIYLYPHPILRQKCQPVEKITPEIKRLIQDMVKTMYLKDGVGLAAPQVGVSQRIIMVDCQDGKGIKILINPKIVKKSRQKETGQEGCLSFPGIYLNIKRPAKVIVTAIDKNGRPVKIKDEGLLARVLQHEIDHLDGILFIDRIGFFKRLKIKNKIKKHLNRHPEPVEGSHTLMYRMRSFDSSD